MLRRLVWRGDSKIIVPQQIDEDIFACFEGKHRRRYATEEASAARWSFVVVSTVHLRLSCNKGCAGQLRIPSRSYVVVWFRCNVVHCLLKLEPSTACGHRRSARTPHMRYSARTTATDTYQFFTPTEKRLADSFVLQEGLPF